MLSIRILLTLIFFSLFAPEVFAEPKPLRDLKPTVILISLDGFRYDYIDKYPSPMIGKLAKEGVRAKWMIPSFPTKTFPNHYTVATGLYPANHGIVENNVYDFGEVFTMSKRKEVENPRWWLGEPIWVTAEKQGQVAASYFFVGTETKIKGEQPSFWRAYNGRVPPEMRVDKLLSWLDLPKEKRPTMMTLYFSDTDDAGHEFSPDSEETKYAVENLDRYLERLYAGLKARKIEKKVNLIITSDHGMAKVDFRNAVFLDEYFDLKLADRIIWTGEIVQIFPKAGLEDEIAGKLKEVKNSICWKKEDIPARLSYSGSHRIAPIVCSADEGWMLTNKERYEDLLKGLDDVARPRGAHGYDNRYQSMQATFIAYGPAFKRGFLAEPFPNVDVYNIMCRILGLVPAKNDGDIRRVEAMFSQR